MPSQLHQAGVSLDYTPSADYVAGTPVNLGVSAPLWGIGPNDIAADQKGALTIGGVYKMPKIAPQAFDAGDVVGFDSSADQVVTSADVNSDGDCGTVVYPALDSDEWVYVLLNGLSI